MALCTLSACKDHSITTSNDCTVVDSLAAAQPGSYWIYNRYVIADDGTVSPTPNYDSLVYIQKDPTITKDGISSMLLIDRYSYDGWKTILYDTVNWVVQGGKLWEYNHTFPLNYDCRCGYQNYLSWRLLVDCGDTKLSLADTAVRADSLQTLVHMSDGTDSVMVSVTQHRVKNTFVNHGSTVITVTLPLPGDPSTVSVHESDLYYSFSIISPANATLVSTGTRSAVATDSTISYVTPSIGGLYLTQTKYWYTPGYNSSLLLPQSFRRALIRHRIIYN